MDDESSQFYEILHEVSREPLARTVAELERILDAHRLELVKIKARTQDGLRQAEATDRRLAAVQQSVHETAIEVLDVTGTVQRLTDGLAEIRQAADTGGADLTRRLTELHQAVDAANREVARELAEIRQSAHHHARDAATARAEAARSVENLLSEVAHAVTNLTGQLSETTDQAREAELRDLAARTAGRAEIQRQNELLADLNRRLTGHRRAVNGFLVIIVLLNIAAVAALYLLVVR
ncbi:hypothetical protein [Micromonospora sp. WMMD712]|uniref:hypothetical protein n=1 Tax=Micromonospora sp. WMMD712 TaxID=3016096 RepID=UPI00249A6FDA|nr:hypothetical protein [Micromonospora sp. WMMD712]WFE59210.1 hypothetical protein O7633_21275 [Micromonospora sp. WMMD712]